MDDATLARAQRAATALKEGRFDAALKVAKAGLKSNPKQSYLANLAGLACVQIGDVQAAAQYFLTAWRSDPEMIEAPRNLAQALVLLGQTDKALAVVDKALKSWPGDPDLLYLVASAHHGAGRFQDAITAVKEGLNRTPASAALYTLRALAFEQIGDSTQAGEDFQHAVKLAPQDPETRRAYAQYLAFHAQVAAAFAHVDAGLAVKPDHEGLLLQKASLHQGKGETDNAVACYEAILAQQPIHPLALNGLAFLVVEPKATLLQGTLAKLIRKQNISRETKMLLGFAQAHLAKVIGQSDAPSVLAQANAVAAKTMPYNAAAERIAQASLFAPFIGHDVRPETQPATPAPIFIVGSIRSGTTLMEQILARHPAVAGLGELTQARHIADDQAATFARHETAPSGNEFARKYRSVLPPLPKDTNRFVDKMPDNFKVIGYLLNAFPNATILEMQRDPRDVALSMWASHFPTMAHGYTYAMPAMAAHMNLYSETMQQWRALFPKRVHAVSYEDLVSDIEPNTQRIATLCGIDWHADMLHPERGTATALTASAAQIRQPVHDQSIGKWQNQGDLLAPFLAALNRDLWPGVHID